METNEDVLTEEGKIIYNLTNIFISKNKEIERLNNIIKEVREEMEKAKYINIEDYNKIIKHERRILEILDKGK